MDGCKLNERRVEGDERRGKRESRKSKRSDERRQIGSSSISQTDESAVTAKSIWQFSVFPPN